MATLHLSQAKKGALEDGAAIVFVDEATFRQDATLHQTWARKGHQPQVPVTGARKSVKIFGAVELRSARFCYHRDEVFNGETYLVYLEHLARHFYPRRSILIQDNASYHKDRTVYSWFAANRSWLEVHQLPPYSPEFNPVERIWHHVRLNGTHNWYFVNVQELNDTLVRVFRSIQRRPRQITGYLRPFC